MKCEGWRAAQCELLLLLFFIAECHHPCLGGGMQSMPCWQGTCAPGDLAVAVAVVPDSVPRSWVSE